MTQERRAPGRDSLPGLQRVVTIVSMLAAAGPQGVPADELVSAANYGGVLEGRRDQLARDVRTLVRQGWVIENIADPGSPAVYRMQPGDPRVRLAFDAEEQEQFQRAARVAGVSSERVSESLADPSDTPELRRTVRVSAAYHLELALHGHEHRCLMRFRYRDVDRVISSDAIWRNDSRWYLVGRAPGDDEQRTFRLDRVEDLHLDRPGTAGPAHDDVPLRVDPLTFVDGPEVLAEVRVHVDHRRRAERALGRAVAADREADEVLLKIPVVSHVTFLRRLCELDTRATLLGPESLREELRDMLRPHLSVAP